MQKFKKLFLVLLRVCISILLLIFLFSRVDRATLFGVIKGADKPLLFLGLVIFFFNYFFCFLRWAMLLKVVDIRLPMGRLIISYSGSIFFNVVLPSTIGGDLVRSLDLSAHTKKPKEIVATVLLDRLSGYVALVILAVSALILGRRLIQDTVVFVSIGLLTFLLLLILLVLFNRFVYRKVNQFLESLGTGRIREAIRSLHHQMHIFGAHKAMIVKNLFLSLIVQLTMPLSFYFIGRSLGIHIDLVYFFIFVPIVGAITLLPISIGGLGLRDASTVFFFAKAGVDKDLSFAMSLLSFSFLIFYGVLGGIIYVLTVHHRRIQPAQPSQAQ